VLLELSVVEQRYDAVMEVLRDGLSKTEVAERYGVLRQSVHAWIARYEQGGMAGLADCSHRPKSCPHQIATAIEAQICQLRRIHPDWGPRTIVHHLERGGSTRRHRARPCIGC
jgi:transposase